jgi:hypothetical protein
MIIANDNFSSNGYHCNKHLWCIRLAHKLTSIWFRHLDPRPWVLKCIHGWQPPWLQLYPSLLHPHMWQMPLSLRCKDSIWRPREPITFGKSWTFGLLGVLSKGWFFFTFVGDEVTYLVTSCIGSMSCLDSIYTQIPTNTYTPILIKVLNHDYLAQSFAVLCNPICIN